jgi:hypothetical protein
MDYLPSPFGGETLSPAIRREPPPNLYTGREWGVERWHAQSNEPEEGAIGSKFHGAQTEAPLPEMCLDLVCHRITLLLRKDVRHELHHEGISVYTSEGLAVGFAPVPEDQAFCCHNWRDIHFHRLLDRLPNFLRPR